ncbi:MAG: hypothetical protein PHV82_09290 [Victivallaceae bacterium]|nr:hypothetical protein [Victivallaceae bacterium]
MKKQLKIWKADFERYWDKTSLITRILIGAAVSLALTYVVINKVNRPLSKEVEKERKAISDTAVVDGAIYLLEDLKRKRDKINADLKIWEKKFENAKDCESSLTQLESGKVIIAVRELFYKNNLKLINEQKINKDVPALKNKSSYHSRHKTEKPDDHIKLEAPEYIEHVSYQIKAYGRFPDIKNFLFNLNENSHVFVINNITFIEAQLPAFDHKFQRQKAVEINFELHIPYLKNTDSVQVTKQADPKNTAKATPKNGKRKRKN